MRARRAAYARAHARIVAPHSLVSLSAALSPRSFTSLALGGSRALARAHEQVVAQLIIYHPRTRARALASLSAALSPPLARLALRRISRISARPQTNKQVENCETRIQNHQQIRLSKLLLGGSYDKKAREGIRDENLA